jgi:hypothetical protein
MSTPPSGARPARLAAFILLGVAVIAVGLGVFALTGNSDGSQASPGGSTTAAPPPTSTRAKPTTTKSSAKPTTTTPPSTTYPSGQTTTVAPPPPAGGSGSGGSGAAAGGPGGSGGGAAAGGGSTSSVPVRVYNNGTIPKLAASAAQDFTNAGYDVVETGNYSESQGVISTTTVYYSPLPGEQATATALGQRFGMRVQPRFPGIASASPGVIVIVTNDFKGPH